MGRNTDRHQTIRRTIVSIGLGALTLVACGADDDADDADTSAEVSDADVDAARAGDGVDSAEESSDGADESADVPADTEATEPSSGGASTALPNETFGRDVITEVSLRMSTSDVSATSDDVRRVAIENGGAVFSSDVTVDDLQDDSSVPGGGTMVIRIPPQDLNRLVEDLDGLGLVTQITQDSEDVTDQLVDLEIRIRQAQAGIARVEELLTQSVELDDLFAIETELSRRQVELERLLAAQRSTEDRVALATLTVNIEYRSPDAAAVSTDGGDDGIADAFADGWNAFVGVVFAIGFVLAVSAPFLGTALVVLALAWLIGRRWNARSKSRSVTAASPTVRPVAEPSEPNVMAGATVPDDPDRAAANDDDDSASHRD